MAINLPLEAKTYPARGYSDGLHHGLGDLRICSDLPQSKPISPGMNAASILVVDDEPDILKALSTRLKFMGFNVISREDGTCVKTIASQIPLDLIILDIGLPLIDGHDIAAFLRSNPKTSHIPVIYLTARTAAKDRAAAEANGAFAYITKPFIAADILQTINSALDGDRSQVYALSIEEMPEYSRHGSD